MKKDGNSKNGYHNVKCQVPETEELERTEKRAQREKKIFINYSGQKKEKNEAFALSYIMHIIHYTTVMSGPVISFR